jgi:hypothetical protein
MTRRGGTTEDPTIEFLTPNDTAFGMSEVAEFVGISGPHESEGFDDEAPRPQWLMAVAGVVVTALIAVGVVAAAPWEGGDSAPAPSTTVPTSSTVPSTTSPPVTTAPPTDQELLNGASVTPTGWVIDNPAGDLQLTGVYSDPLAGFGPPMDWMSVWTTPDATAETGRWLAITTLLAQRGSEPVLAHSTRFDVNGQPALLTSIGNGGFRLRFSGGDGTPYQMAGFGLALDQIIEVAGAVTSQTPGRNATISFGDLDAPGRPLDGMQQSISESVLMGGLEAQVAGTDQVAFAAYFDPNTHVWVNLQRSTETPEAALLAKLLITPSPEAAALGLPSDIGVTMASGEVRDYVVGTTGDGLQTTLIRWTKDGQILTLTGNVSATTLIDLATASRQAFVPEWRQLVIDSQRAAASGLG